MARCNYIDEDDVFTGLEHPSRPVDHRRILKVWKTHCVPQTATFWTKEVWEECGPLDESLPLALDYDLFCRFSRRYRFHFIDEVLANYRLHGQSKSCTNPQDDIRAVAIELSRRYWGSALLPRYWLLWLSLAWDRFAREHNPLQRARQAPPDGLRLRRRLWLAAAALLAPRVSLRRWLPRRLLPLWDRLFEGRSRCAGLWQRQSTRPETLIYRSFTGLHHEGTIGPVYETDFLLGPGQDGLRLEAEEIVSPMPGPLDVEVRVDGRTIRHVHWHNGPGPISLVIPLCGLSPGRHRLTLRSSSAVTLYDWTWVEDHRPLSLRLRRLEPVARVPQSAPSASSASSASSRDCVFS
jgi:hypothetical protein